MFSWVTLDPVVFSCFCDLHSPQYLSLMNKHSAHSDVHVKTMPWVSKTSTMLLQLLLCLCCILSLKAKQTQGLVNLSYLLHLTGNLDLKPTLQNLQLVTKPMMLWVWMLWMELWIWLVTHALNGLLFLISTGSRALWQVYSIVPWSSELLLFLFPSFPTDSVSMLSFQWVSLYLC
jgi:hypothetical protein